MFFVHHWVIWFPTKDRIQVELEFCGSTETRRGNIPITARLELAILSDITLGPAATVELFTISLDGQVLVDWPVPDSSSRTMRCLKAARCM